MRFFITLMFVYFLFLLNGHCQQRVFPVISDFGGVYDIPTATVKADTSLDYHIVVDLYSGSAEPENLNMALNNVARMLNLHYLAGSNMNRVHIVLAVHAGATNAILSDEAYRTRYDIDNPNSRLLEALSENGVDITVCGQSLLARSIDIPEVNGRVQIATSMLTTVTTYSLKGYSLLRF